MKDIGDLGTIAEEPLNESRRPGGKWSVTDRPVVTPPGGRFTGPVEVRITCPTDGASIAYATETDGPGHWNL
jgi:hypothetical protein